MGTPKMAAPTKFAVLARNFSSSSASAAMVKPPVQVFGLEGRYASALYSAASKKKSLEKVEKELTAFQETVAKDTRLAEFIKNPILKRSLKVDALSSVAENGRLSILNGVINSYKTIMAAYRGEVTCEVTSVKALDAAALKEIETALNGFLQKGQSLQMTTRIDPAIVGGLVVVIGDRYIDMSLATKMQRYSTLLKQAV